MIFWLVNHSWESFKRTQEYCWFMSLAEQEFEEIKKLIIEGKKEIVF